MKRILLSLLIIPFFPHIINAQVGFGDAQLFNDNWEFVLNESPTLPPSTAGWKKVDVPHDWSIEGTPSRDLASCTGYLPGGIGWYRKTFTVNDSKPKHYIYFEGVYNRSEVYLNGHLLGKRPNGYVSFMYDLTPYLKAGTNELSVRVDHSRYADSRWYTGSGIYRNVWFISAEETHLAQWGVSYEAKNVTAKSTNIHVSVEVEKGNRNLKDLSVKASLIDAQGKNVNSKLSTFNSQLSTLNFQLSISNPHLWSVNTPYLYTLHVDLLADGKVIDQTDTHVGIRSLQFDPNHGFALNGEWMKVKGVCIHHDAGVLGAAVPREVWQRRFLSLKEMGVNAIRMSHNMQAPDVYDLADEMGFLIMDEGSDEWEYPKRKWLKGWNQGTPGYDGTYDFFEEWIDRDIADMVRRDRNHPSVFLWSVGNEVDYPNDPYSHPILDGDNAGINQPMYGGYKKDAPRAERIGTIAKRLATIIRNIDPSRPVTGAMAGVVMSNQTEYPEAVDICGYNYTENRYVEDHKAYPKRIIYGSETSTNLAAWKAVRDNPHIFGHFVWTGYEYLGESGAWPSRGLGTGLIDFAGFLKPRGHFFASLWRTDPVAYIGTQAIRGGNNQWGGNNRGNRNGRVNLSTDAWDNWNYQDGQTIRVLCYTNQPYAHLLLNGREVGEKKERDDNTGIIYWEIPYEAGTLRVEGLDKSGPATTHYDIRTHGEAKSISALEIVNGKSSNSKCLHLLINIVDAQGIRVLDYRKDVKCEVISGGKLLGLENANNSDMSAPKQNHKNANRGQLLAYILRTNPSAPAKVRITAEGLDPIEVNI
jgi:hypothetical protein